MDILFCSKRPSSTSFGFFLNRFYWIKSHALSWNLSRILQLEVEHDDHVINPLFCLGQFVYNVLQWPQKYLFIFMLLYLCNHDKTVSRKSVTRWLEFFHFWLLTTIQICPKFIKICQSRFTILRNTKYSLKSLPKILESLPKWRYFAKSGHTDAMLGPFKNI